MVTFLGYSSAKISLEEARRRTDPRQAHPKVYPQSKTYVGLMELPSGQAMVYEGFDAPYLYSTAHAVAAERNVQSIVRTATDGSGARVVWFEKP